MSEETAAVFTALYDVVYDDVLRYVTRRLHPDGAGAEDVVAEAMTTAWRRRRDLPRELDDARAWVFGIARGCLLNDARSRRRRTALGVRLASIEGGAVSEDGADLAISRADLARAWSRLSDDQQDVLSLAVFEGLDSARAGRVLSISAAAYRVRLARARSALRHDLDVDSRAGSIRPLYEETR
ncbi:MAG: sigma-70 family RNA polymerase sigma factor [Mobilicoccus sp.]|nr:sigma-70 family RNA polymerase sigma factor [Mobilicoccus sp.]